MFPQNCHIWRGYFVDRDNHLRLKIPPDTYACGVYTTVGVVSGKLLDFCWYKDALLQSDHLLKFYYMKVSGAANEIIVQEIASEIADASSSKYLQNVVVEKEKISQHAVYGTQGQLIYSSEWRGQPVEPRIDEIRYVIKDGFLLSIIYRTDKKRYENINNDLLDAMFDKLIRSFSVLTE